MARLMRIDEQGCEEKKTDGNEVEVGNLIYKW